MASSLLLRRLPPATKHAAQRILTTETSKRSVSTVVAAVQQSHPATDDGIQNQTSFFSVNSHSNNVLTSMTMMQTRSFAEVKTAASETSNEEEVDEAVENEEEGGEESLVNEDGKKPSVLESLPENYTPGHALYALRAKGSGGAAIRRTEFHELCLAARPGWKKDASAIKTALLDFKRVNSFLVDELGAKLAMEGMMRSMMPSGHPSKGSSDGERRLMAALFVAEAFAKEKTGLCFSAETKEVDVMLKNLCVGVQEFGLKLEKSDDDDEESEVAKKKSKKKKKIKDMSIAERVIDAVYTTIYFLNRRADPSEKKMKKRAARKFVKQLVTREGPSTDTAHFGAQICLEVGGLQCAKDHVVIPYRRRRYKTSEETNALLEKAQEEEEAAAANDDAAEEEEEETVVDDADKGEEQEDEASNDDDKTEK